jgi:hypothetical protein
MRVICRLLRPSTAVFSWVPVIAAPSLARSPERAALSKSSQA